MKDEKENMPLVDMVAVVQRYMVRFAKDLEHDSSHMKALYVVTKHI